jgi:FAM192A/Fyv6, N-terminal domain
VFLGHLH